MSIIRDNLMTRPDYTPYCGDCSAMPRSTFDGEQFICDCGWRSRFSIEFIIKYKTKWEIK